MQIHVYAISRLTRIIPPLCCSTTMQGPLHESHPRSPRSIVRHRSRSIRHHTAWCKMVLFDAPLDTSDARDPPLSALPTRHNHAEAAGYTGPRRATKIALLPVTNAQNASNCTDRGALMLPFSHHPQPGKGETTEQTSCGTDCRARVSCPTARSGNCGR